MYHHGWYQVAFERDLTDDVSPAHIGSVPIVLVREETEIRAFSAICPHRGANLAMGGRLEREALVCPFHGYRIGLGRECDHGFRVRQYPTLSVGGLLFVQLSDTYDCGFTRMMEHMNKTHIIVPGFTLPLKAPAHMIVENAFDSAHFRTVHAIQNEPRFTIMPSTQGEVIIEGIFEHRVIWHSDRPFDELIRVPFKARAFSPGIVVGSLAEEHPYSVLTAATPDTDTSCTVRLSLLVPLSPEGKLPSEEFCRRVIQESRRGLEQDRVVWENMFWDAPNRLTSHDNAVREFRQFCTQFEEEAA